MVSLKMTPFRARFTPFKNAISINKTKSEVKKQFKHVTCTDEEVSRYFRSAAAAMGAMAEIGQRSWEYQFEFAAEMARRCKAVMGGDPDMIEAYEFFEQW